MPLLLVPRITGRSGRILPILLACSLAGCRSGPARFEDASTWQRVSGDLLQAPARIGSDFGKVFGDLENREFLGTAGVLTYGLELVLDGGSFDQRFRNNDVLGGTVSDSLDLAGRGSVLFGTSLAWMLYGSARDDRATYEAGKSMLRSLTVAGLTSTLLKVAIPDDRPDGNPYSFPSGHATESMAFAATIGGTYGHRAAAPLYLLSLGVGIQRMDDAKHDLGDVLFGWALGYVVGRTLAEGRSPSVFGAKVGLFLAPEFGGVGVGLTWR